MKIAIIINSKRLTPQLEKKLKCDDLSLKYNISYDLFVSEPENVESLITTIKNEGYTTYIIGGGDGTVRSAIQALMDTNVTVCILPLGTFNLLAKALNYPNDVDEIFAIIKNGKTKQIDLLEANGLTVINHAWIGLYFYILKLRKKHQAIIGKNKLLKIIFNAFSLFKLLPIYDLKLKLNNQEIQYQTCLVYIGNNEYSTNLFDLGERSTLSTGLFSVTILNCQTRWQLFRCMLSISINKIKNSPYISRFYTDEVVISAKSKWINIVIDGDLFKLESPLRFINLHKTLTVYIP